MPMQPSEIPHILFMIFAVVMLFGPLIYHGYFPSFIFGKKKRKQIVRSLTIMEREDG